MKIGRFELHPVSGAEPESTTCLGAIVFSRYFDAEARQSMIRARVSCAGYHVSTCVREPAVITETFLQQIEDAVFDTLDAEDRGPIGALASDWRLHGVRGILAEHC